MKKLVTVVALLVLAGTVGVVFGNASGAAPTRTAARIININVAAASPTEFKFKLARTSVPKGSTVIFTVTNKGQLAHDFKVNARKTKVLPPKGIATLKVTFAKAGRYPYLCTVTGHAAAGMRGVFVVK